MKKILKFLFYLPLTIRWAINMAWVMSSSPLWPWNWDIESHVKAKPIKPKK